LSRLPGYAPGMNTKDLIAHRAELFGKLKVIELEKSQLVRKLKALDILLEGLEPAQPYGTDGLTSSNTAKKRVIPPHTVRFSPRKSLIDAVQELAFKQPASFDSVVLLNALQIEYPEFGLIETKHISSPLSDLVKKGVLTLVRSRSGSRPNIYSAVGGQLQTPSN